MNLNSDLNFVLDKKEAKSLWMFLNSHENDLDTCLYPLMRRLESGLWNHLSIDDMNCIKLSGDNVNE